MVDSDKVNNLNEIPDLPDVHDSLRQSEEKMLSFNSRRIIRIIEFLAPALIGTLILWLGLRLVVSDWVRFGVIVIFLAGGFGGIMTMAIISTNSYRKGENNAKPTENCRT